MGNSYLWFKFFHLFFVIAWFAGLFYLPRIFVNLALAQQENNSQQEYNRLLLMAKKLYRFMSPWAIGSLLMGFSMAYQLHFSSGWIYGKLFIGLSLAIYHFYFCKILLRDFELNRNKHSDKWYRFFNEIPVIFLLMALFFVIFKSF